jgi:hypothetical protein
MAGARHWIGSDSSNDIEYDRALAEALAADAPAPELAGGIGFNPNLEPNPNCPECFGRGVESVIVTDTRKLTGKAAKLYAGVQQTNRGNQGAHARPDRRPDRFGTLRWTIQRSHGGIRPRRRPCALLVV